MRIRQVQIKNYRSIALQTIRFGEYSLLIGANNSGKSNIIDALRTLYEKDLKFEFGRDFPKFPTDAEESWIELVYELDATEAPTIKGEYLFDANCFRVRKWMYPPEKSKQGFFGYENGSLTENLFYGWKNVGQGKLGEVTYIPPVSRLEEHTKLTGPSALRDLINQILRPVIRSSAAFSKLSQQFKEFGDTVKVEQTADKQSLARIEETINREIASWGLAFNIGVASPEEDEIVKNLVRHTVTDLRLNAAMDPEAFGHGFQRYLIFTLIRIAASLSAPKPASDKKEFSPQMELLLFEEPEAFLHPPQQTVLDESLRQLAMEDGRQVIAATHSPLFVSRNTDNIADLVRVCKDRVATEVGQVSPARLREMFEANLAIRDLLGGDEKWGELPEHGKDLETELEATRHFLWLDPGRCGMFFADWVLLVEGLADKVLVDYLIGTDPTLGRYPRVFVLDSAGKYNIHRFMNLLGEMKIHHIVFHDLDKDEGDSVKPRQALINEFIQKSRNPYTVAIDSIPSNLEIYLGVDAPTHDRWKASKLLLAAKSGRIERERLDAYKQKIEGLLAQLKPGPTEETRTRA